MIEIRRLRSDDRADYARVLKIRTTVFVEEQNVARELEVDEFEDAASFFLALADGEPVATGRTRTDGPHLKFERIATLPAARGKGLATELMREMEADGRAFHPELLPMLHAQLSALSFYQQLGWIPLGEPFTEAEIEHRTMIRSPSNGEGLRKLRYWSGDRIAEIGELAIRAHLKSLGRSN